MFGPACVAFRDSQLLAIEMERLALPVLLDVESFAFCNYQYILYGMEFQTDLSAGRSDFPNVAAAQRLFDRIRVLSEKATRDLPSHRALVTELAAA